MDNHNMDVTFPGLILIVCSYVSPVDQQITPTYPNCWVAHSKYWKLKTYIMGLWLGNVNSHVISRFPLRGMLQDSSLPIYYRNVIIPSSNFCAPLQRVYSCTTLEKGKKAKSLSSRNGCGADDDVHPGSRVGFFQSPYEVVEKDPYDSD